MDSMTYLDFAENDYKYFMHSYESETDFITDTLLEALYFDLEQVTDHQMAKVEEIVMGCEK